MVNYKTFVKNILKCNASNQVFVSHHRTSLPTDRIKNGSPDRVLFQHPGLPERGRGRQAGRCRDHCLGVDCHPARGKGWPD